jgi:hypothetical protein
MNVVVWKGGEGEDEEVSFHRTCDIRKCFHLFLLELLLIAVPVMVM